MIHSIKINNIDNTIINYLQDITFFQKNKEITFDKHINIIVGNNGSGKSTLLKIIEKYLLIGNLQSEIKNIDNLIGFNSIEKINNIEVNGDYYMNNFKFSHVKDLLSRGFQAQTSSEFVNVYNDMNTSTGESIISQIYSFFEIIFSNKVKPIFPLNDIKRMSEDTKTNLSEKYKLYLEYIEKNKKEITNKEYICTLLLDEIDRNLDMNNINQIYPIFETVKEDTQLIAVVHNPIIIYKLSKLDYVNIIETSEGYVNLIKETIENL